VRHSAEGVAAGSMHFHCKSLLPRPGRGSVLSAPSHSFPLPALPSHENENVSYFCSFGIVIDSFRRHSCFSHRLCLLFLLSDMAIIIHEYLLRRTLIVARFKIVESEILFLSLLVVF